MGKPELSSGADAIWKAWLHADRPFAVNELGAGIRAVADQGRRGAEHREGSVPDDFDKGWDAAMDWVARIADEMDPPARSSEEI
jgi:hypothetical protein